MYPRINYPAKAEKEIVINYSLEQVKSAVMFLFENFPESYQFREEDINEAFNIYHFPIASKLYAGIADLSLTGTEEGKTKINISVVPPHGSRGTQAALLRILNEYLLILGKVLNGEDVTELEQTQNGSGAGVLIGFIFFAALILSLLLI